MCDQIIRFVEEFNLIGYFNEENLKPAGYELRVGKKYAKNGKIFELTKGDNELIIEPFDCTIISTMETINMPRFLIARWDLRVAWVYKGLLWMGAPQVDPGYCGHLFCPIFNLSNEEVRLKWGDSLALIDFVNTTKFNKESEKHQYKRPPKRTKIEDYNVKLKSALFAQAKERVDEMEDKIDKLSSYLYGFFATVLTVFSILIATLSILVSVSISPKDSLNFWYFISIIISIIAIILSSWALIISRKK